MDETYIVYRRREKALPQYEYINLLERCEWEAEQVDLRHHLLFSALYHRSLLGKPIPPEGLKTLCRVRVPDAGGVLSLELGYREPYVTKRDTALHAEIAVWQAGERELILDERLRVMRRQGAAIQSPYRRFDLDLSRWAGRR